MNDKKYQELIHVIYNAMEVCEKIIKRIIKNTKENNTKENNTKIELHMIDREIEYILDRFGTLEFYIQMCYENNMNINKKHFSIIINNIKYLSQLITQFNNLNSNRLEELDYKVNILINEIKIINVKKY